MRRGCSVFTQKRKESSNPWYSRGFLLQTDILPVLAHFYILPVKYIQLSTSSPGVPRTDSIAAVSSLQPPFTLQSISSFLRMSHDKPLPHLLSTAAPLTSILEPSQQSSAGTQDCHSVFLPHLGKHMHYHGQIPYSILNQLEINLSNPQKTVTVILKWEKGKIVCQIRNVSWSDGSWRSHPPCVTKNLISPRFVIRSQLWVLT